jgi:putative sugar O-methyltransferase
MRNENMFDYPELIKVREDMLLQDKLYQPTSFWHEASSKIVSELFQYGIENFRSLQTALGFFVPTYGSPGSAFSDMQSKNLCDFLSAEWPNEIKSQLALNKFLNGYFSALSDYRVLKASDDSDCLPYLHSFSESKVGNPIEQFEFDNRFFSRSSLNYLLGLSMLKKHLNGDIPRVVLEIGGGFGTLGEVLGNAGISNLHYIDIDIPPTSYIAEYYLGKIFGKNNVAT